MKPRKRKPGRPKDPVRQSTLFTMRLTPEEYFMLKQQAAAEKRAMANLGRVLVREGLERRSANG